MEVINNVDDIIKYQDKLAGEVFTDYGHTIKSESFVINRNLYQEIQLDSLGVIGKSLILSREVVKTVGFLRVLINLFANKLTTDIFVIKHICREHDIVCLYYEIEDNVYFIAVGCCIGINREDVQRPNVLFTKLINKYCNYYNLPKITQTDSYSEYADKYTELGFDIYKANIEVGSWSNDIIVNYVNKINKNQQINA